MEKVLTGSEMTLADLPIGMKAVIVGMTDAMRGRKKFADAGMVAGTELAMEGHAPFGSLLRVRVMDSSLTLHKNDGANILVKAY
ncbi:MAG: ferrous iron transport protein A [Lentisphaerae bacterium]|nr:ferrous iron transport protein A [Lentisphaerota bacterium]